MVLSAMADVDVVIMPGQGSEASALLAPDSEADGPVTVDGVACPFIDVVPRNTVLFAAKGAKGTSNVCYAASKATALIVARVAAAELGEFGINVNSVCPGPTRTELMDRLEADNPEIIRDMVKNASLRRMSAPHNIADAVVYLSSSLADNVTGQSINVDGGILWD